ncbi:hypothetical protein F511_12354 [Dorcoceras hygrometricum]|uniref:Methyltransferase type 11 domain-containing protein n=1 Tax=Dorcoceras hygrometricum TaxID=472368 RepID=A0A2Z7BHP7_9LAMI|nr:hypothetical protein F511_12354 [Dorcoceras hygrometricum]
MTGDRVPENAGGHTQAYGESWYWDDRYTQDPAQFDWYQSYPALAPLISFYIRRRHHVLVVGCGNSAFSESMVDDGYDEVVNIDFSSVVIEAMKKKYPIHPNLKYMTMDARDMSSFSANSFDAVVDKGTLDSLLCGQNSRPNANRMLEEVYRVLKENGVYILITYGSPLYRLSLLRESCSWAIKLHTIEKLTSGNSSDDQNKELMFPIPFDSMGVADFIKNTDVHYIYVCIKVRISCPSFLHYTAGICCVAMLLVDCFDLYPR